MLSLYQLDLEQRILMSADILFFNQNYIVLLHFGEVLFHICNDNFNLFSGNLSLDIRINCSDCCFTWSDNLGDFIFLHINLPVLLEWQLSFALPIWPRLFTKDYRIKSEKDKPRLSAHWIPSFRRFGDNLTLVIPVRSFLYCLELAIIHILLLFYKNIILAS